MEEAVQAAARGDGLRHPGQAAVGGAGVVHGTRVLRGALPPRLPGHLRSAPEGDYREGQAQFSGLSRSRPLFSCP